MDALLEALAKLLGVFKEPVQILFLLITFGLSYALAKVVKFLMDAYGAQIDSRVKLATALDGLTDIIKEKIK